MEVGRRGRGRGRAVWRIEEEGLREEIRVLRERLAVVEAGGRRDPADDSDEDVAEPEDEFEGVTPEFRLLKSVLLSIIIQSMNYPLMTEVCLQMCYWVG